MHAFRDGFLPYDGAAIKEAFEELKARMSPALVLTHSRDDRHQDHRLVSDLTWNTWRDHLILEYEIPKYDGDFGNPNTFAHLSADTAQSQSGPPDGALPLAGREALVHAGPIP